MIFSRRRRGQYKPVNAAEPKVMDSPPPPPGRTTVMMWCHEHNEWAFVVEHFDLVCKEKKQ